MVFTSNISKFNLSQKKLNKYKKKKRIGTSWTSWSLDSFTLAAKVIIKIQNFITGTPQILINLVSLIVFFHYTKLISPN